MHKPHPVATAMVTGAAAAAVVGTASYIMTSSKKKTAAMVKKNAGKALRAVGGIIENASYMMR